MPLSALPGASVAQDPLPLAKVSTVNFGALGLLGITALNPKMLNRQRGFSDWQMIYSVVLLESTGDNCPDDNRLLADNPCLERDLGYRMPRATALREALEFFMTRSWKRFVRPASSNEASSCPTVGRWPPRPKFSAAACARSTNSIKQKGETQCIATIDQSARIIQNAALTHYDDRRECYPMVSLLAELDILVADELRYQDMLATQAPLIYAKMAFGTIPASLKTRYFRGDSLFMRTKCCSG